MNYRVSCLLKSSSKVSHFNRPAWDFFLFCFNEHKSRNSQKKQSKPLAYHYISYSGKTNLQARTFFNLNKSIVTGKDSITVWEDFLHEVNCFRYISTSQLQAMIS